MFISQRLLVFYRFNPSDDRWIIYFFLKINNDRFIKLYLCIKIKDPFYRTVQN